MILDENQNSLKVKNSAALETTVNMGTIKCFHIAFKLILEFVHYFRGEQIFTYNHVETSGSD
jgi:hypothetical protein